MDDAELVKRLIPTGKSRVSLYLAPTKVEHLYLQMVTTVTELKSTTRETDKLSGNLFGFLGGELGGETGLEGRIAVSPLLQAIVIERAAHESGQLIDLASTQPEPGKVLRYFGPARFTRMGEEVAAGSLGLSHDAASAVARRRALQEEILRFRDDKIRTVVLAFEVKGMPFAAIASTEFIDLNPFSSYFTYTQFGMLCRLEGTPSDEVRFLDPFWIWYEGF